MNIENLAPIVYLIFIIVLYSNIKLYKSKKEYNFAKSKLQYEKDLNVPNYDDIENINMLKLKPQVQRIEEDIIISDIKLTNLQDRINLLNQEFLHNTDKINSLTQEIKKDKNEYDRIANLNKERLENKNILMDFGKDNLVKSLIIILNSVIIENNIDILKNNKKVLSHKDRELNEIIKKYEKKYNQELFFTPIDYKPIRGNGKDRVILNTFSFRLNQSSSSSYNLNKLIPYIKRSIKLYDGITAVEFLESANKLEKNYEINYEYNKRVYIREEYKNIYLIHTLFGNIGEIPHDVFYKIKRFLNYDFLITWSLVGGKYRFIDSHPYTEKDFINTAKSSYKIQVQIDFYKN